MSADETPEERSKRLDRERAALVDRGESSLRQAIYNAFAPIVAEAQDDCANDHGSGVHRAEQVLLRGGGVLLRALAFASMHRDDGDRSAGGIAVWSGFTEDDMTMGALALAGFLEGGADLLDRIETADDCSPKGRR